MCVCVCVCVYVCIYKGHSVFRIFSINVNAALFGIGSKQKLF